MRLWSLAVPCVIAMLFAAPPAAAQITVTGIRPLAFGGVVRGVPSSVPPTHATKSGQFRFVTAIGNTVRVQFTLPTRLNGPSGGQMPITFSATDAVAQGSGSTSVPVTFNPNTAQTFNIQTSNTINVFIGGRVSPAANQTLGAYSNTITLTVTIQ